MKKRAFILTALVCAALFLAGCANPGETATPETTGHTVSVDDYGAVGDGAADDQPAIQQALDYIASVGGGTVNFTPGKTYLIKKSLLVKDYTSLYAYGATVRVGDTIELLHNQDASEEPEAYSGHSHITVTGGVWDADALNGKTGTNRGQNGFSFTHCEDIVVRDVTILNTAVYHAIELNACRNSKVLDCQFLGFYSGSSGDKEAIQLDVALQGSGNKPWDGTMCDNIEIAGCYCGPSDKLLAQKTFVGSHTTTDAKDFYTNIIVRNNIIDSSCGVSAYYWKNCIISGNIITSKGSKGIVLYQSENVIASDNIYNGKVYESLPD